MRATYDRDVDALAIRVGGGHSARTVRVTETVRVDLDADGRIIAIEVLDASWHLPIAELEELPEPETLLTIAEAAEETDVAPATLRALVREGRVAGRKQGRGWLVDYAALLNYLEAQEPLERSIAKSLFRQRGRGRR